MNNEGRGERNENNDRAILRLEDTRNSKLLKKDRIGYSSDEFA